MSETGKLQTQIKFPVVLVPIWNSYKNDVKIFWRFIQFGCDSIEVHTKYVWFRGHVRILNPSGLIFSKVFKKAPNPKIIPKIQIFLVFFVHTYIIALSFYKSEMILDRSNCFGRIQIVLVGSKSFWLGTGKPLSEALIFAERRENMLCT